MSAEVMISNLALPKPQQSWLAKINLLTDSGAYNNDCQIEARNDLEAVEKWLKE